MLSIVWPRLVVEEANLHVQVSQLRKVIGPEAIVTVPGLGYRFAAALDAPPAAATGPRRLSVIVLPFIESGAQPEQEYFADAITDDITTQLSKIKGSYVIGSPTAFAYKREASDVATVARELGVRYVLQGRIERSEEGVETNVRLSDATTGAVIWSDVIVVANEGIGNIRREVVARLSMALGLQLVTAEVARSCADATAHPAAIDLVMQAHVAGGKAWSREGHEARLLLYQRALELQPGLGAALAGRAHALTLIASTWPGPDIEVQIAQAESDVMQALAQDASDPMPLRSLSRVRQLQFRLPAAIAAADQALDSSPNDSYLLWWRGVLAVFNGEAELAFDPLHRALALSPRDPYRWGWLHWLGTANLLLGRYEQAIVWLEKAVAVLPFWGSLRSMTAAYGQLGQVEHAQAAWRQMQLDPATAHARWLRSCSNPVFLRQLREHHAGGLVKAGVVDGMEWFEQWAARQRPGTL